MNHVTDQRAPISVRELIARTDGAMGRGGARAAPREPGPPRDPPGLPPGCSHGADAAAPEGLLVIESQFLSFGGRFCVFVCPLALSHRPCLFERPTASVE